MVKDIMTREEHIELARKSQDREVLDRLSRDEDWLVRKGVALNPGTPGDILDRLSQDEHYGVRYRVAENPNTSITTLIEISRDENSWVSSKVDENPKWQALQDSGLLDVAISVERWLLPNK